MNGFQLCFRGYHSQTLSLLHNNSYERWIHFLIIKSSYCLFGGGENVVKTLKSIMQFISKLSYLQIKINKMIRNMTKSQFGRTLSRQLKSARSVGLGLIKNIQRLKVVILKWPIPLADSTELAIFLENRPFLSTLCTLKIRGIGHNSKESATSKSPLLAV